MTGDWQDGLSARDSVAAETGRQTPEQVEEARRVAGTLKKKPKAKTKPKAEPNRPLIPDTLAGYKKVLAAEGIEFRLNVRAIRREYRLAGGAWLMLDDYTESSVRQQLKERYLRHDQYGKPTAYWLPAEAWKTLNEALLDEHQVDPFIVYLESLPPWDGTERLHTWLETLFEIDDLTVAAWIGRYLWTAAVRRAYQPGSPMREVPVLISQQEGIGKSLACRTMLPPEWESAWFSDSFSVHATPQQQLEATSGAVIVEAAELTGLKRADQEKVKQYITSTHDRIRRAYARNEFEHPRRHVMVGTTNDLMPLPDSTGGNTRFIPQRIIRSKFGEYPGQRIVDTMNTLRPLLWAEALHCYRQDHDAHSVPPEDIRDRLTAARQQATYRNEELIEALADFLRSDLGKHEFTMKTVLHALNRDNVNASQSAVRNTLQSEFKLQHPTKPTVSRRTGKKGRYWINTTGGEDDIEQITEDDLPF